MLRRFPVIPIAICAFWVIMMTLLVRHEWGAEQLAMDRRIQTGPTNVWMAIYLPGDKHVGFFHASQESRPKGGIGGTHTIVRAKASLMLLGRPTDVITNGEMWRSYDGNDATFEGRLRSGDYLFRIAGRLEDGKLQATIHTAGEEYPVTFPVGDEFNLAPGGLGVTMDLPRMEVGKTYTVDTLDPLNLSATKSRLTVLREEYIEVMGLNIEAKVIELESGGQRSLAWVNDDGEVLRVETPFGFSLERTTSENAVKSLDVADAQDFLGDQSVRPSGETPFRGAKRMRFELSGVADAQRLETDETQRHVSGTIYEVRIPEHVPPAVDGGLEGERNLDEYLASTPLVQSEHRDIRRTAREIIEDETDPWTIAVALHDWVDAAVEDVAVVSVPSALDVLKNREGDCNEHTTLYTALARSVDVPTRIAIGLVWSEENEAFYYHAWPEVYVHERWIWMDPTLGQPVADATHIKILNGGIQRWTELLPYITNLQIEVIEIE